MQERRRVEAQRRAMLGPLAKAEIALRSDLDLAARVTGALATMTAAGVVAGSALALVGGSDKVGGVWLAGVGAELLCGLVVALLVLLDRRHPARVQRGQGLLVGGLALFGCGVIVAAVRLTTWSPLMAAVVGAIVAVLGAGVGMVAQREASRAIRRAAEARRRAWHAQLRASRLTRRMIGMAAYRQLRREGALPVKSTVFPQRTYLVPIRTTPSGARILVLENDRPIGGLCLRPREPLPDPEEALTHILAIRTDERAWLNRANFFPQDRALTPQALGLAPGRPGNYER